MEDYKRFWKSPGLNYRDSLRATHFAEMYGFSDNQSATYHQLLDDSQKEKYGLWETGLVDEENLWRRERQNRGTELV